MTDTIDNDPTAPVDSERLAAMDSFNAELAADVAALEAARNGLQPVTEPEQAETETTTEEATGDATKPETEETETEMAERIKRAHIEARQAKRRAKELEAELEIIRGNRTETTDETVQREATALARQMAAQEVWNRECNRIADAGNSEFTDFPSIIAEFREAFPEHGGVPQALVEAAIEVSNGQEHRIIHWLGKNIDEAERIATLPPARQGAAIQKIADRLATPKVKPVSQTPPPHKTIAGSAKVAYDPATASMDEFMRVENEKMRKRGKW